MGVDLRPRDSGLARWRWKTLGCVALVWLLAPHPARGQHAFQVIVHQDNPVTAVRIEDVSDFFLKRMAQWSSGVAVEPIELSAETAVREAFSLAVHGRTASQIRSFWQQQVFSGRAVPPLELSTSPQVVEHVRGRPGAIGYVALSAPLNGVKRVRVIAPPKIVQRVEPSYPAAARNLRLGGDVVLSVEISEHGEVLNVTVVRGLGGGLSEAAVAAVRRWRFEPASMNGLPVANELELTLRFTP